MANCRFLATRDMNILPIDKDFAMRKLLSTFCATALAASVAATGVLPASAGPVFMPKAPASEHTGVIQIRDRSSTAGDGPIWKKRFSNNNNFSNNNFRGRNWNGNNGRNWDNGNWNNGRKYGWYNGHRGYRYKRQGDRYHDGFWFPAGAFIAGAIIGGAISNNNNYNSYRGSSDHVQYCYDRYRSYRASDNTFQPYNGPRQQCYSPYS